MHLPSDDQNRRFSRLFTEHELALRTFVRSLVPTRADASEVLQDVEVVLWEKTGEFDESKDFRKWAFGVARYLPTPPVSSTMRRSSTGRNLPPEAK